jgi:cytochrome c biogenesis protein CcmG, thiol:disulfide interchange protein DsbE
VKRILAWSPLAVLAALAILFGVHSLRQNPEYQPQVLVGKPMPDLTLPELVSGQPTRIAAAAQRPALVNFFASWCGPCEIEHPLLMQLQEKGVRVVGVAYKDQPPKAQGFLDRLGDPFAAKLVDQSGRAGIEFGITGVPETFLVGADGVIIAKHTGPLTPEAADRLAQQAAGR